MSLLQRSIPGIGAVGTVLVLAACSFDKQAPDGAAGKQPPPPCVAAASWFTPPLKPADFTNFTADSTNCQFHQWAWQEFLYLTTPDSNGQRPFEALAHPSSLFVESGKPGPYPGARPAGPRLLLPRHLKLDESSTEAAIAQAGSTALFDQNGQVVYYEARVNRIYYDFVSENGYYDPKHVASSPKDASFPVGSVELKISWRIAKTPQQTFIRDAKSRFITAEVLIAPVTGHRQVDGKWEYVVDTNNPVAATVALVGMHVVGRVNRHPEFIWSTFEHVDNAPALADIPPKGSGTAGGPWSFYGPGTAADKCNTQPDPTQVPAQPPYAPTEVCRVNPEGGGSDENITNIKTLNASVAAMQQDPVLRNYELGGGLWTNDGALPPSDTNNRGSLKLANSTLETYFQGPPPDSAKLLHCFICHNQEPPFHGGTPTPPDWPAISSLNFSHLFGLTAKYR